MELTAKLYLTPKGEEELRFRTFKLSVKRRSLLILVDTPRRLTEILAKTILKSHECVAEIEQLVSDEFIGVDDGLAASTRNVAKFTAQTDDLNDDSDFVINEDVMLSEAKFQLAEFCVNTFGTESQKYVKTIIGCRRIEDVNVPLGEIVADLNERSPGQLVVLKSVIYRINEAT